MKKFFIVIVVVALCSGYAVAASEFDLPQGGPLTLQSLARIITSAYDILITLASVAMVVTFVVSGIMWLSAGDNPDRVKRAKKIFWGGLVGSLIILGVGVIINTISYFVLNVGDESTRGSGGIGATCRSTSDCRSGLICDFTQGGGPNRGVCAR